ncbi:hypothetical protein D3C85_1403470 [compost metagenome]
MLEVYSYVRVPDVPGPQHQIQLLHAEYVGDVILAHLVPRLGIALEALGPQLEAGELGVLGLLVRRAQLVGHPLQFLAGEAELLLRHEQRVHDLIWRRGQHVR